MCIRDSHESSHVVLSSNTFNLLIPAEYIPVYIQLQFVSVPSLIDTKLSDYDQIKYTWQTSMQEASLLEVLLSWLDGEENIVCIVSCFVDEFSGGRSLHCRWIVLHWRARIGNRNPVYCINIGQVLYRSRWLRIAVIRQTDLRIRDSILWPLFG